MSRFRRRHHRSSFDHWLCGGSSSVSTVVEEEEDVESDDTENDVSQQSHYSQTSSSNQNNNSILSTPTRTTREKVPLHQEYPSTAPSPTFSSSSRVMSPTSVSSAASMSAAVDVYDDEPSSPVEWYYGVNYNQSEHDESNIHLDDENESPPPPPPFITPSFFTTTTPWMCVFDLDAACGGDSSSYSSMILDTTEPYQRNSSSNSTLTSGTGSKHQQHENWNALLPTVMDMSQWFVRDNSCTSSRVHDTIDHTIHEQSSCLSPMVVEREHEDHDPKPIPLPLSPTSVRQPIMTLTPSQTRTRTEYCPSISTQLFTNYATDCDIETIYFARPSLQHSTVCNINIHATTRTRDHRTLVVSFNSFVTFR